MQRKLDPGLRLAKLFLRTAGLKSLTVSIPDSRIIMRLCAPVVLFLVFFLGGCVTNEGVGVRPISVGSVELQSHGTLPRLQNVAENGSVS